MDSCLSGNGRGGKEKMQELAENYRKMIELRGQQQEQPSEEVISSEVQAVYQEFYQKLQEKHLTEAEKASLKQEQPELYEMIRSLEREMEACQEKLLLCKTKEEVLKVKEDYKEELLRGLSMLVNNPTIPLMKRLEYTMFKDTKRSLLENLMEEFIESDAYKRLPGDSGAEADTEEEAEEDEEAKLQRARHARARARYEGVRSLTEEKDVSGAEIQVPFDVKG